MTVDNFTTNLAARLAGTCIGPVRYNSPWTQVVMVGFITFCSAGMFSAVGGLGAGGTQDAQLADTANAVLYAVFALSGFFSGSINNLLGPRLTLSVGTMGYTLYVGALWAYQVHGVRWFVILSGAILGVCAGMLWAAQGAIMMAYPKEEDKGRSFSLFWAIFAMGSITGSAIAFGIEYKSTLPAVSTGVYMAFVIIQLSAMFTSWLVLPPHLVVRGDGTVVQLEESKGFTQEFKEFAAQFKDKRMLLLFPMFFSSNFFYSYQGAITAYLFNGRTRALSALTTGIGAIVGSLAVGVILDRVPGGRRRRSMVGLAFVTVAVIATWAGGLHFQLGFKRADGHVPWDFTNPAAMGGLFLLATYYIGDASYQGLAYYTMSSMTNSPAKLARMAGYYKGVQSAGGAISWAMDAVKTPYLTEHLVSWILLLFSLALAGWVMWSVKDSNYEEEPTAHVEDLAVDNLKDVRMPKNHHLEGDEKFESNQTETVVKSMV